MSLWRWYCVPFVTAALVSAAGPSAPAQEPASPAAGERPSGAATPMPAGRPAPSTPRPASPDGSQPSPGEPKKENDAQDKKPEDASSEPKTTRRPAQPPEPADPAELEVRPDAEGKLRFNFRGQPWPDVLEWLGDVSGLSLDWQELPGDYLNLTTRRSYTVAEARDLINRHLLARGFTLVRNGEVLSVLNLKNLDPAMIPRLEAEDLDSRDPHEFAKISFQLDWLPAERAAEELKPMLSPHGRLTKLESTNRLEAIDSVQNLREIHRLLQQEQSDRGQERLVREFRLKHTRAHEVSELLHDLLGLEKASGSQPPATPEQQMMQRQMMQQMQQMQQQQQGKGQPGSASQEPQIAIVVNRRENSLLAHAPPEKMAVIAQAVQALDVESDRARTLLQNVNRMQVYRLASLDPEPLVDVLTELGDLDPTTRVQVDKKNRSIIVYGTLADHVTVRTLVDKLDGTDRRFEVIPLRRLEADYVAGTIEFMMGGGEKKQQQQPSPYIYYPPRMGPQPQEEPSGFRVDADVEFNRLLLWANDVELQEVENLLVKLGEIPARGGDRSTLRVLDAGDRDADQTLERLRRLWPSLAPNPLILPPEEGRDPRDADAPPREIRAPEPPDSAESLETRAPRTGVRNVPQRLRGNGASRDGVSAGGDRRGRGAAGAPEPEPESSPLFPAASDLTRPALLQAADSSPRGPASDPLGDGSDAAGAEGQFRDRRRDGAPPSRGEPAPITIIRRPDGRVAISSSDTEALDLLEDLLGQLAPPRRDFKIFQLKHRSSWAYGIARNLEDFFKEEEERSGARYNPYYFGYYAGGSREDSSGSRRLSKRRPLKFISDSDTNTILVTGADPAQLRTIEELIDIYDQPESQESGAVRQTKVFYIRYSQAKVIADAVKDVYRDLLSANDPALQTGQQQNGERPAAERSYTYIYGLAGDEKRDDEMPIKFKGLLSIGVDELSNTLVVSATEGLIENISAMIQALDDAARPTSTVQVLQLDRSISSEVLQQKLTEIIGRRTPPEQPQHGQAPQPGQAGFEPGGPTNRGARAARAE